MWLARSLLSCYCLAVLLALADVSTSHEGESGGAIARAALFAVGVYGLCGGFFGVLGGLVLGSVIQITPAGALGKLRDKAIDHRVAAFAIVAALGLLLTALAIAALSIPLVGNVARKSTGALTLSAVFALVAPLSAVVALALHPLVRRIVAKLPGGGRFPLTAALAALTCAAIVASALAILSSLDWRVLPIWPIGAAIAYVLLVGITVVVLSKLGALDTRPWRTLAVLGGLVVIGGIAAKSVSIGGEERSILTARGRTTPMVMRSIQALGDGDGDGVSRYLGGGDCDDTNPNVFPGAIDIPGNGIDENCQGGDAQVRKAETPSPGTLTAPKHEPPRNLLFIVIDTMRADRLGVAGYRRNDKSLTPNLDALAEQGTLFRRAYAQAPNTPRSFPSMFFSRYPSHVAWKEVYANYATALPQNTSLFEVLQSNGFRTVGVASHFYFTEERGILQGFDRFNNEGAKTLKESNTDVAAPRILQAFELELDGVSKEDKRFALFVHLFEPHSAYLRHDKYPISGSGDVALEERYDYEIAVVDEAVGTIVDSLRKRSLLDTTAIAIVSDHGEAFGEHRFAGRRLFFHGQTLYDELLRVPMILRAPGFEPRTVDERVTNMDLAPTLLELLGLTAPVEYQGQSLVPALLGNSIAARPVVAELLPAPSWKESARTIIVGDDKLIQWYSLGVFELFDLKNDPTEQTNLIRTDTDRADKLKRALADWSEGR